MKIVGIGETVFDIVFKNGVPQVGLPGGSVFNSIISLGRTVKDVEVIMATQMGHDYVSDIITTFLRNNNVSTAEAKCEVGRQSTISLALLNEQNDARYEFFRDKEMPPFKTPDICFEPSDIMLFGSFFAISPATREQVKELVERANKSGATVYYDINFRKGPHGNSPHIKEYVEENIAMSHIVRGSHEDVENIYGPCTPAEAYNRYIRKLCRNFVCTKGADETEVFSDGLHTSWPVIPIETVSTIGAGDSFNAGVVYTLWKEGIEGKSPLSEEQWRKIVSNAQLFSANVCKSLHNYVDKGFEL